MTTFNIKFDEQARVLFYINAVRFTTDDNYCNSVTNTMHSWLKSYIDDEAIDTETLRLTLETYFELHAKNANVPFKFFRCGELIYAIQFIDNGTFEGHINIETVVFTSDATEV